MSDDQDGCEWVFLLVPAYPGCPGPKAVKRLCVCVVGVSDLRCGAHCQATESTKDRVTKRMKFYGAAYNYDTLQPSSDDTVDESTATVSLCSLCSLAVSTACCSLVPCALSEA